MHKQVARAMQGENVPASQIQQMFIEEGFSPERARMLTQYIASQVAEGMSMRGRQVAAEGARRRGTFA
jgi:hypothetical protein